ncbi:hypothetical protein ACIQXD_00500 [Streptomyces uncialis]|uniref:hypothetical protein n=1 Tax=Streptomyces uncialis TaxID=1048205 RepID=UPI0038146E12
MAAVLPRTAREIRLAATPEGLPRPEHLAVVDTPMPVLRPGHVLVRNRYFLVLPGLRTLMGDEIDGVPLSPLRGGDTLFGPAVCEVVAVPPGSPLRVGDTVSHLLRLRRGGAAGRRLPGTRVPGRGPSLGGRGVDPALRRLAAFG